MIGEDQTHPSDSSKEAWPWVGADDLQIDVERHHARGVAGRRHKTTPTQTPGRVPWHGREMAKKEGISAGAEGTGQLVVAQSRRVERIRWCAAGPVRGAMEQEPC